MNQIKVQIQQSSKEKIVKLNDEITEILTKIKKLLLENQINLSIYINSKGRKEKISVENEIQSWLIKFFDCLSKLANQDQIMLIITKLFILIVQLSQEINKKNTENVRYLYINSYFYIFINQCIKYLYDNQNNENLIINKNIFIAYLDNLQNTTDIIFNNNTHNDIEIIKNNINKLFSKITTKYSLLDKLFENYSSFEIFKPINISEQTNFNIIDFIIAFCLLLTNINDFSKFSFKTVNTNDNVNIEITDQDQYYNKDTLVKQLYTIYESNILDILINNNGLTKEKLALYVLIKCKKIIWNIPIIKEIHYFKKIKVLFLNFLVNFEKSIYKVLPEQYNNLNLSIENALSMIYKDNLYKKIKYFYDFEYFVKLLLYCINCDCKLNMYDSNKLKAEINNKNIKKLIKHTSYFLEIYDKSSLNKFLKFFTTSYTFLINNHIYHHFTLIPKNRKKISKIDLDNSNIYNKNYISFKRAFDFVKDFNDLTDYYCSLFFNNIARNNLDVSFTLRGEDVFNSIFWLFQNMLHVYFDIYTKTGRIPYSNPLITEKRKKQEQQQSKHKEKEKQINEQQKSYYTEYLNHEPCIYASKMSSYSKFISSFLNLTKDNSNFIVLNDISIENTAKEKDIKKYFDENFASEIEKIKTEKKNLLLFYTIVNDQNADHGSCIIINFEKGYVDFYNCFNMYKFSSESSETYELIYPEIIKYFKNLIMSIDKLKINVYNHFDNMAKMQVEYDTKLFAEFCHHYTLIYEFVRLLYFNKKEYTMNYVQEKINEYFMSFNHLTYFMVVFSFLFALRCSNIPDLYNSIFYYDKNRKKLFKYKQLNDPDQLILVRYNQILLNPDYIKNINTNFNKLFKPLRIDSTYNINVNNNINISNNNNYILQNDRIQNIQESIIKKFEQEKAKEQEQKIKQKEITYTNPYIIKYFQEKKREEEQKKRQENEQYHKNFWNYVDKNEK